MKIAWDNTVDSAAISASSELSTMPGSNVKLAHLSQKWGTAAGAKTAALTMDLGSAKAIDLLAVLGTNLTSAATMRLRASNADATAVAGDLYDSGVVAAGVKDGYGAIYKAFNSVTARYWRLDLTDNTVADNLLVGRVFLGPSWTPETPQNFDWGPMYRDDSKLAKSTGGQAFIDARPKVRVLEFVLDYMTEAEAYTKAFAAARANGRSKDFLVIPDINSAYVSEQSVWGLVTASRPIRHRAGQLHRQEFTIEERL